jgi:hypothetical protein
LLRVLKFPVVAYSPPPGFPAMLKLVAVDFMTT